MNNLTGRAGGALTNKFGVNMADTCGAETVVNDLTEEVGVACDTVATTVVSGEVRCGEIFTGTAGTTYGAEISTGAVVTGGSCAAW